MSVKPEDFEELKRCVQDSLAHLKVGHHCTVDEIHQIVLEGVNLRSPWIIKVVRNYFKLRLIIYRYLNDANDVGRPIYEEQTERLEFGIRYGCTANAMQRKRCIELFDHLKISIADRAVLLFSRTVNVKTCEIRYGRWDRIVGAASVFLHTIMILFSLSLVVCACSPLELRLLSCFLNFPVILFSIFWHKTMITDAHKIGSKYFVEDGWRLTPRFKS